MLYLDGVYAEDNYGKTRFDDEHPCTPNYGHDFPSFFIGTS
jgi:hypothetical protein